MTVDVVKLIVSAVLAVPAAWFAAVLVDRIPDNQPLWSPMAPLRFSGRYLAIDLVVLGCFLAFAVRFADVSWWVLAPYLGLAMVLVALSAIDLDVLRLPDRIVVPSLLVSIVVISVASIVLGDAVAIQRALVGGATYFGFLFLFHLIFGNRGMGFGDVKLSAVLGLYLGWLAVDNLQAVIYVMWGLVIGVLGGSVIGIVLYLVRGRSRSYPFGPFLVMGTIVLVLFGRTIVPG